MSTQERHRSSPSGSATPRTRSIVCGVDGSAQAREAAISALHLAGRLGARLMLVHVTPTQTLLPVDSVPAAADPRDYVTSTELAYSEAEEAFDSLPPEVTSADAGREVRLGRPAVVLAEVAAEHDAEIIVVGSRGRGAWRSAVLGSVSAEVARLAPCPVMIVPERAAIEDPWREEAHHVR
jgi:nucleotide-binding universal stress UspA family protein